MRRRGDDWDAQQEATTAVTAITGITAVTAVTAITLPSHCRHCRDCRDCRRCRRTAGDARLLDRFFEGLKAVARPVGVEGQHAAAVATRDTVCVPRGPRAKAAAAAAGVACATEHELEALVEAARAKVRRWRRRRDFRIARWRSADDGPEADARDTNWQIGPPVRHAGCYRGSQP